MKGPSPKKISQRLKIEMPLAQTIKWVMMGELPLLAFTGVMTSMVARQSIARETKTTPYDNLNAIDSLLQAHGIETIRQSNVDHDSYWFDTRAIYVNMGDTYVNTVLYDIRRYRYEIISVGDFIEREERRGCKFS
jgi:hypothetical protein